MKTKANVILILLSIALFQPFPELRSQTSTPPEKFSASLLMQEESGGMAGRTGGRAADTTRGMAREILERSFVYRGSPKKALLLSLLVPGLGQHYVKARKSTWFFGIMETGLWATMIGHKLSARWAEDNYKAFAADHAQVSYSGKGLQYFVNIGNFMNIYDYNHKKLVDRYDDLVYEVTPENYWQWDSGDNRARFRKMRVDADATRNRATYFGAGVMINHLISAIHAALVAKQGNPIEESLRDSGFHVFIDGHPQDDSPVVAVAYKTTW